MLKNKISFFKKIIPAFHPGLFKQYLKFNYSGYLFEVGWNESFKHHRAVDLAGNPLPWVTYSFIDFITPRLKREMNIFEYGSGNSTLFYSKYVKNVHCVEHDYNWYEYMRSKIPGNVKLIWKELKYDGDYCRTVQQQGQLYHIIFIDGRDRFNSAKNALDFLLPIGILVLDDSERETYRDVYKFYSEHGFRFIDFWGMAPGEYNRKSTTIFYKPDNCLEI